MKRAKLSRPNCRAGVPTSVSDGAEGGFENTVYAYLQIVCVERVALI